MSGWQDLVNNLESDPTSIFTKRVSSALARLQFRVLHSLLSRSGSASEGR